MVTSLLYPTPGSPTGRCSPKAGCWPRVAPMLGDGLLSGSRDPAGTWRLPRGQYSVRMQMFGGSVQAPMKRVRCSFWTSRI